MTIGGKFDAGSNKWLSGFSHYHVECASGFGCVAPETQSETLSNGLSLKPMRSCSERVERSRWQAVL
jgi:hypothetical protein